MTKVLISFENMRLEFDIASSDNNTNYLVQVHLEKIGSLLELIRCGIYTLEESVSDILQSMWKTEHIRVKILSKSLSVRVLKVWFYPDDNDLYFFCFHKWFYQSFEKKFESGRLPVN